MLKSMVTTALEIPGHRIVKNYGIARGITVRSRSIVGNIFGGLQTLFGGNITIYTQLCEETRSETYHLMVHHAERNGANAIIDHSGGLTFAQGATFLSIGNFVIDTANSNVTGFAMNSGGLNAAGVPLFTIGSGLTLSLTATAAGALSATFFNGSSDITQTLTGFKVGVADPQPTTVTPEPASLLLVASGVLGALGAGYRRFATR